MRVPDKICNSFNVWPPRPSTEPIIASGIRICALKQPGEIISGGCGVNAVLPYTLLDLVVDGGGTVAGDVLEREAGGEERWDRKERGGSRFTDIKLGAEELCGTFSVPP